MRQISKNLNKVISKQVNLNYLLYLPKADLGRPAPHMSPLAPQETMAPMKWPLILFLHGAGERGSNLELVKKHGIPKIVETEDAFPFITVSPQCPANQSWSMLYDDLYALLQDIGRLYAIDEDHIYLTGISMGGYGTWGLAAMYPHLFAAIAPVCGGGLSQIELNRMKDLPVWVFHGQKDPVVPIELSRRNVNILKEFGAEVQFTVYPDLMHDCWTVTYANPALFDWFLAHKRHTGK